MPRDPEKFWAMVSSHFFVEGALEMDYDVFLTFGSEAGLIHEVPYDPELHGDIDDSEPGDAVYVPVPRD